MLAKIIKFVIRHPIITVLIVFGPLILIIFLFILIISMMGSVATNHCSSGDDGGSISANFSIKNVLNNSGNKSKQIEEWCASKHMDAAQTAGVLGNSMAESTLGTATSNLMGMGANGGEATSDTSQTKNDSVSQYMNTFIKKFSPQNCQKYIKDMKGKSPYECGYWWGKNIEVDGANNNAQRGKFAQQFYKKIAGGSTTVSDADSTANSGSNSNCGGGSSSDTSNIIQYAESQIGKHHYTEAGGTGHDTRNGMLHYPDSGWADCSSFGYFVYRHCGMKVKPFDGNAWTTDNVSGPKEVSKDDTEAGSICENSAHMVILKQKFHGNSTKVVEEGGGTDKHPDEDNVNDSTVGEAYGSAGGNYHFYNPVQG